MRRSEINARIDKGVAFLKSRNYPLPPQAHWSLSDWNANRAKATELTKRQIGWDLTDFGLGNYDRAGLLLYTLSNGLIGNTGEPGDQSFSNKILIVGENQVTVMHHHRMKTEDIITLGGGNLQIRLFNVGEGESVDRVSPVKLLRNSMGESHAPGSILTLHPGERVRLEPCHYHEFWGQPGMGTVLVEEVASVNDDRTDNFFSEPIGRFPEIIEDEEPPYLLCTDLPGTEKFEELVRNYL